MQSPVTAPPRVNMQPPVAAPRRLNMQVAAPPRVNMQPPGNGNLQLLRAAALNGNWNDVEVFLDINSPQLLSMSLTPTSDTALHIATRENRKKFVEKLVTYLSRDNLALRTTIGHTALCIAAISGFKEIAEIMISTNHINECDLQQSLFKAVQYGCKEMAMYLFQCTKISQLEEGYRMRLFVASVKREMCDIALKILETYQDVALHRDVAQSNLTALHMLVQKPQDIFNGSGVGTAIRCIWSWICGEPFKGTLAHQLLGLIWEQVLRLEDSKILEFIQANPNVFFEAVKFGNVKFVTLLVDTYLMWNVEEVDIQLLHKPILYRQGKIFNQIYKVGALKDYVTTSIDADGNNMLHFAGKLSTVENLDPPRPNLQLQPELFWFKKMQRIMSPEFTEMTNREGLTPKDVFLKEHRDLIITARTAMNGKASSYLVVSTVIATIVFAAALIVPGLTNGPREPLIFQKDTWFRIFVISNAVALYSSATSTIMLLWTLTSRFVESEYITSLRPKMMCGVTALLISIASMVIAFTAAFFMIFDYKSVWVPYFTASLASVPVISILVLQYKHYKLGMWLA